MSLAATEPLAAAFRDGETVLRLDGETAMRRLGEDLALALQSGDVVALSGPLGAGKTTLARALVRCLAGDPGLEVPSPTFTLEQRYDTHPPLGHFDLYRLEHEAEADELGLDEAAENGIVLVEWPERAPAALADAALQLRIEPNDGERRTVHLRASSDMARRLSRTLGARAFLREIGHGEAERRRLAGDASARRYESVRIGDAALVLMDSPALVLGPPVRDGLPYARVVHTAETVLPFVAIAEALEGAGFSVPRVLAADLDAGFVLTTDLGREGVLDADGRPVAERYEAAALALAALHGQHWSGEMATREGRSHTVPPFDRRAMETEIDLLLEWYLPHVRGRPADAAERARFAAVWAPLLDDLQTGEQSLLLRDVHSPNILWQPNESGWRRAGLIDFQDAMIGPAAYDLASLGLDARADVPPELEARLVARYTAARRAGDPGFDAFAFERAYALAGTQRLTKILGIFVRLLRRDGKPDYLVHLPRVRAYLRRTLGHPALCELRELYDAWGLLDGAEAGR